MLLFWIILAAAVYFTLLAGVLAFFAGVSKVNRHWENAFRQSPEAYDDRWRRAA